MRWVRELRGLWWFLVPVASVGYLTFAVVLHAGRVMRHRGTLVAGAVYFALEVAFVVDATTFSVGLPEAAVFMLVNWVGGTVHAAALTARYRRLVGLSVEPPEWTLAVELRIGRPDRPRSYDDGGLIDVNRRLNPERLDMLRDRLVFLPRDIEAAFSLGGPTPGTPGDR